MKTTHRLIQIGNSVGIVMPKLYLEEMDLRLGDLIEVYFDEVNRVVVIRPRENVFICDPKVEFNKWMKGYMARIRNRRKVKGFKTKITF